MTVVSGWAMMTMACQTLLGIEELPPTDEPFAADAGASSGDALVAGDCPVQRSETSILFYAFDDDSTTLIADSVGSFTGAVSGQGALGTESLAGCGRALEFSDNSDAYVTIPDAQPFHLDEGAIEFLVRIPESDGVRSPLGRDAQGIGDGHLSLYFTDERRISLRMQKDTPWDDVYLCSEQTLAGSSWHHVVINLGAPEVELFVDGIYAGYRGSGSIDGIGHECDKSQNLGISRTDSDWVLGATNATGIERFFHGGAIDQFHIRSARIPLR